MSTALRPASQPEQPHNRAVWSDGRCAGLLRLFCVESPLKGSLRTRPPCFPLIGTDTTRCRLAFMRDRRHPSAKTRSSPDKQTQRVAREGKRLAGKREEMIGVVYEMYGRCNEVVLRIQDDVRTLVDLHRETTELLYILRSLPAEGPPEQVPTTSAAASTRDSESRLPRLLPLREVAQRVALSRSTIWRMERAGQFPKRRRLSVNKVAWWEPEIEEWVQSREQR
jgi:prophage regulatory protein